MMTTRIDTKARGWAAFWAVFWGLELAAGSLSPAWAQRRRADPEANPSFQGQVSGGPGGGGPISAEAAESEPQGEVQAEGSAAEEAPAEPERPSRNVRIGAEPAESAPPPAPVNPLDTRIVVRVKNAPLSTFLDTISAQAKVNFIITEGLESKRVTAFLQNVTVREALQILLEIKGLTYQRIGRSNTYVVSPRAKGVPNRITRIYTLNYIPLMPTDPSSGGGGNDTSASAGAGGQPSGGGEEGGEGNTSQSANPQQGQGGVSSSGVSILNVLRSVLSTKWGNIAVDPRTNSIIVTDTPESFPQVEQILAELDRKAPQVMIEAQIVEINSDRANQLGLEWGGTNGELAKFTGGVRDSTFPLNLPKNLAHTHFFDPVTNIVSAVGQGAAGGNTAGQNSGNTSSEADNQNQGKAINQGPTIITGNNVQSGIVDLTQLTIVLRALVTRAEARFLGKPKILTLNNKLASITVSRKEAVSIQSQVTGGASGITAGGTSAERFLTGLTLKVTPQVNREGFITMLVEPSFTNVLESRISSQSNRVFDPTTRAASSLVRVKNGQTLVLGGLLESRETKAVRKVPFLGYIPLIGWLFTSTSNQRSNTDLVIFLTPTVVND